MSDTAEAGGNPARWEAGQRLINLVSLAEGEVPRPKLGLMLEGLEGRPKIILSPRAEVEVLNPKIYLQHQLEQNYTQLHPKAIPK